MTKQDISNIREKADEPATTESERKLLHTIANAIERIMIYNERKKAKRNRILSLFILFNILFCINLLYHITDFSFNTEHLIENSMNIFFILQIGFAVIYITATVIECYEQTLTTTVNILAYIPYMPKTLYNYLKKSV